MSLLQHNFQTQLAHALQLALANDEVLPALASINYGSYRVPVRVLDIRDAWQAATGSAKGKQKGDARKHMEPYSTTCDDLGHEPRTGTRPPRRAAARAGGGARREALDAYSSLRDNECEWEEDPPSSGLPLFNAWGFEDSGVFYDVASLFQNKPAPRTPHAAFAQCYALLN